MALKPYWSKKLMIVDLLLALITGGAWIFIVIFRELYRANKRP